MKFEKALSKIFITTLITSTFGFGAVNFPGGRIAMSFDGNHHDDDDIVALPMSLGLVHAAGLVDNLVHVEYSNHVCPHPIDNDGTADFQGDDNIHMRKSADLAKQKLNLPDNIFYEIHNTTSQANTARDHLAQQINNSTSSNPLWIVAAGPMETVYRALEKAGQSSNNGLANTYVVSHSKWNQNHGDCGGNSHTWSNLVNSFSSKGTKFIESCGYNSNSPCTQSQLNSPKYLPDQNQSDGDNDWNTPISKWTWLKNLNDNHYNWIYDRNPFGNKFDPSDAGIVYFLISGGPNNGGDKKSGWPEAKSLFSNPVTSPSSSSVSSSSSTLPPSSSSSAVSSSSSQGTAPLADITDLTATATSCSKVLLKWSDKSTAETQFIVRRKQPTESTFSNVAYLGANSTTWTDNDVSANTDYIYMVRPANGTTKKISNQPTVFVPACETSSSGSATTNITDLKLAVSGCNKVKLTWTDSFDDESGYIIRRKKSTESTYKILATISSNQSSYLDQTAQTNAKYTYMVRPFTNSKKFVSNTPSITSTCSTGGLGKISLTQQNQLKWDLENPELQNQFEAIEVTLYNLSGEKVWISHSNSGASTEIALPADFRSFLPVGVYVARIQQGERVLLQSMIGIR
jgi:hypothetical protein